MNDQLISDMAKLQKHFDVWTRIVIGLKNFITDLADLNNPDIDKLFDKYEITVEGKYPRKK